MSSAGTVSSSIRAAEKAPQEISVVTFTPTRKKKKEQLLHTTTPSSRRHRWFKTGKTTTTRRSSRKVVDSNIIHDDTGRSTTTTTTTTDRQRVTTKSSAGSTCCCCGPPSLTNSTIESVTTMNRREIRNKENNKERVAVSTQPCQQQAKQQDMVEEESRVVWDDDSSRFLSESDDDDDDEEDEDELFESDDDDDGEILLRLEKKFECRMERLRHLSTGWPSSYIKMLEAHEEAAHQVLVAKYKNRSCKDHDDNNNNNDHSRVPQQPSLLLQSWWMVLFEWNHTVPALYQVLLVCMGHATFYASLDVVMKSSYYSLISNNLPTGLNITLHGFHGLEIIFGLVLIRINGNIFHWDGDTSSYLANIELRNRSKLGWLDAIIMKRMKGTIVSSAMNMIGFYLVYMGLNHFYYGGLLYLYNVSYMWYESIWKQAEAALTSTISTTTTTDRTDSTTGIVSPTCNMLIDQLSPTVCYPDDDWLGMDYHKDTSDYNIYYYHNSIYQNMQQWLIHQFCMDSTYEWRILSLAYHIVGLVFVATLIAINGDNILRYCDD